MTTPKAPLAERVRLIARLMVSVWMPSLHSDAEIASRLNAARVAVGREPFDPEEFSEAGWRL